ncbi:DUF3306 domain-containing protein [Ruegeria pomeroyi]|uniref:DUF3306 domain-containing protein n=2 Tax=Ruegeria pomeroyi TaxID=89184 RepID=Q5LSG9_RUEPO|nr:DUF3306 domain-containing protein [Ruegeria pomeroyi]AAV95078.1 hypothetical protein SPO1799 [Ruegeria pomeroyi DSS-3]NVK99542.1 DUF3306 domain-containing protein [Ruegeria pomeroyi]NVL02159.1 DUF3306 domain-containing protein [Ruegeria pomeroyi]QWV08654.1 DUF3306 domain-containing protein [Ruegeria pomeroyi]
MSARGDFWSRRRAGVAAEERAETAALELRARAEAQAELEQQDDAEILARLDLPDPDLLQPGDDVSRFMSELVPDRLRRRALRRLWRLNPVLANVDGLVDYGEDFTDATRVIEGLQTAYQVGRGMLRHVEALAAQAEAEAAPEPDTDTPDLPTEEPLAMAATEAAPAAEAGNEAVPLRDPEAPAPPDATHPEGDTTAPPAPRRMRFTFEG